MRFSTSIAASILAIFPSLLPAAGAANRPVVTVTADHTVIAQSCRVVIPPGTVINDSDGKGAIQIGAANIEIEFAEGSVLRGSPADTRPDEYKGCGIRLNGHAGVSIRGARISGFWCGLHATQADGLLLDGIDASDNRRAHLKSTTTAEDGGDWLFGHDNDKHEWLTHYAAAVYIEESAGVTVRDSRVRHGQNALCLDRVTASRVYDNDFSFNSGWGIALWRCARNVISRNAVDFCVRGYSHGVYNRGQDSAGIFVFEQNNENVFAENSVTHGGDGFFGFAGREALGEIGTHPLSWYKRRGNTDNIVVGNDLSYAPAHGIENTFSFGNKYLKNRIVGNAICGIWAGYSRETLIAGNDFENNGEMGYGLERGGVNIDHGGDNIIVHNSFLNNKCGVHLWGGANLEFEKKNWAKANGYASTGSVIAGNTFRGDDVAFHFRGPGEVTLGPNKLVGVGKAIIDEPAYRVTRNESLAVAALKIPAYEVFGKNRPVGARPELRGRQNIIMTEWGPWDHVTPLVRLVKSAGGSAVFDVLKTPAADVRVETVGDNVRGPRAGARENRRVAGHRQRRPARRVLLRAQGAGGRKTLGRDPGNIARHPMAGNFLQVVAGHRPAKRPRRLSQTGRRSHCGLGPGRSALFPVRDARAQRVGHLGKDHGRQTWGGPLRHGRPGTPAFDEGNVGIHHAQRRRRSRQRRRQAGYRELDLARPLARHGQTDARGRQDGGDRRRVFSDRRVRRVRILALERGGAGEVAGAAASVPLQPMLSGSRVRKAYPGCAADPGLWSLTASRLLQLPSVRDVEDRERVSLPCGS